MPAQPALQSTSDESAEEAIHPLTGSHGPFGVVPGLVWAFRFGPDGMAIPVDLTRPIEVDHNSWLWLHLNLSDTRARNWIADSHLPASARTALLAADSFQQLHPSSECIYGVFADLIRHLDQSSKTQLGFLHFAMTEHLLISGRHHPLTALEATRQELEEGRKLKSVAGLLEMIIERVAAAIEKAAEALSTELDELEEALMTSLPDDHRGRLSKIRRASLRIHRQVAGMRASFQRLERDEVQLKPSLRVAAAKLAQRLDAIDHEVCAIRDRSHLLQEEAADKLTEETNRQLRLLTVVTTLLLPATFVTGVFGMNVKGLPLTDNETGFVWAMLFIVASSVAIYWLMRRLGILR
jgi:zinc transporter